MHHNLLLSRSKPWTNFGKNFGNSRWICSRIERIYSGSASSELSLSNPSSKHCLTSGNNPFKICAITCIASRISMLSISIHPSTKEEMNFTFSFALRSMMALYFLERMFGFLLMWKFAHMSSCISRNVLPCFFNSIRWSSCAVVHVGGGIGRLGAEGPLGLISFSHWSLVSNTEYSSNWSESLSPLSCVFPKVPCPADPRCDAWRS